MGDRLIRFSVSADENLARRFDRLLETKGYTCRSEAIRDLMRDFIVESRWEQSDRDVVGTVTVVYDHKMRELSDRLVAVAHDHHEMVISSMHVHLDRHNCLEVTVLRGTPQDVCRIADRLISMKGVKHGKLVMSSTGDDL